MHLRAKWAALLVLWFGALTGCSSAEYYAQAIGGQFEVMRRSRPLAALITDPDIPVELRSQLETAAVLRAFASSDLALPDNSSYRSYADLGRPYVVWNVFAAGTLSLEPKEWCYPIVGCLSYRGFFLPDPAHAFAAELQSQGYETWIGGVPAYSTLGWFDDPLLNTFIAWPEGQLAELMFHELAHQRVFRNGDTQFNESFAVVVGRLGAERWLQMRGDSAAYSNYLANRRRRDSFLALTSDAARGLEAVYSRALSNQQKALLKRRVLEGLAADYRVWKRRWRGYSGYDKVMAGGPSNAWFVAAANYHEYVPAFQALFQESDQDFERFYDAVQRLAALPDQERTARLEALAASQSRPAVSLKPT